MVGPVLLVDSGYRICVGIELYTCIALISEARQSVISHFPCCSRTGHERVDLAIQIKSVDPILNIIDLCDPSGSNTSIKLRGDSYS